MVSAFLITAWIAFICLSLAYCAGLLPPSLIRPTDRYIFRAHSRRSRSQWRVTIERVALVFSDQQLITGLAILIAGFYEAFSRDLQAYYWKIITSLAYLSSTVNLLSLSFVQERLNHNRVLRNMRLSGMITLLALLITAMIPTTNSFYAREQLSGIPARCFWRSCEFYADVLEDRDMYWCPGAWDVYLDSSISYALLVCGYLLNIGRLFDRSRSLIEYWIRAKPEAALEQQAKSSLLSNRKLMFRFLVFVYILHAAVISILESFMGTILALLFTLVWTTEKITNPAGWRHQLFMVYDVLKVPEGNSIMSFGQLLPLLLLVQPLAAIADHFTGASLPQYGAQYPTVYKQN